MEDQIPAIRGGGGARSNLSEDCIVLLEELIQSNRNLAAENERLRQEHQLASKQHADVLNRIERRLNENVALPGERNPHRRRSRRAVTRDNIIVPSICRVSTRKILCLIKL